MALIAAHLLNNFANQNAINQHVVNQNNQLTTGLYIYQNILHMLYYDEAHILPVGISVDVPGFNQPFIYFSEEYAYNHTRALNNYVYYGRNNNEVNERRTLLLNHTNIAKNLLVGIQNTYRH